MFAWIIGGLSRRCFTRSAVGRRTCTYRYRSSGGGKGWNFIPSNTLAIGRMAENTSTSVPGEEQQNISATGSSFQNMSLSQKSIHPLVWIDCEMTGLNPPSDKLLQIACFVTDSQLDLLDETGFEIVISRPESLLNQMDTWCTDTHTATGLIPRVLSSEVTVAQAATQLLSYIKKYVPEKKTAIMCGNSIHFDKLFLSYEMPEVVDWLGYRVGDVSSIKEFARRWCEGSVLDGLPVKKYTHEAKQDILESIEEARYYRKVLFGGAERSGDSEA